MKKIKIKINPKYKEYLPSKNFGVFVGGGLLLAIIVLAIVGIFRNKESFSALKTKDISKNNNSTISDLLQTDTDLDGVYDWEEALWGTNKNLKATFGETPDSVYIKQKKDALSKEGSDESLNETDKFARSFFASYIALQSSGGDTETVKNFSKAVGEKIGDPNLVDVFAEGDVRTFATSENDDLKKYYTKIQEIFDKYRETGMGDEIDLVNSGLLNNKQSADKANNVKLASISKAYKDFANDVMRVNVPQEYVSAHVKMANTAYNTGVAVSSMTKISDDPIVGLSGLTQYQKYSEEFLTATGDLEDDLTKALR